MTAALTRGTKWRTPPARIVDPPRAPRLRALLLVLVALALFTVWPFWLPLAFAAWLADLLLPVGVRLEKVLGGRRRSAAAILVLVVVALLVPLSITTVAIIGAVRETLEQTMAGRGDLFGGTPDRPLTLAEWADMARNYGADAWTAARTVARASMDIVLGGVVFAIALYNFLAHRVSILAWLDAHTPIPADVFQRFKTAFRETGRGLIVGIGATAFLEGVIATIAFFAMGIPRAFVLGAFTAVAGLTPVLGTAPVWVPLAISLFLAGDHARAIAVVALGIGFGLVDNFVRPVLTRYGRLDLPSFVVLVAMLGGISVFGPSGAILGPLVVRFAIEALRIARERKSFVWNAPCDQP